MALKRVNYDDRQYAVYARGRAMSAEVKATWMRLFADHLPAHRPLTIVDLGCGIGRITPALAETFGGRVYGVEPSRKMREIAEAEARHPAVTYMAGEAAKMPLPDDSADVVLMMLSLHHVPDRAAGAAEIARVLRPDGRVLIRSAFSDRLPGSWWHQFFPRAREIEKEMFPPLTEVEAEFGAAGLKPLAFVEGTEQLAASAAEAAARMRPRPYSTFEHLSEDEIADGFARLDVYVAAETEPTPVIQKVFLLVLG